MSQDEDVVIVEDDRRVDMDIDDIQDGVDVERDPDSPPPAKKGRVEKARAWIGTINLADEELKDETLAYVNQVVKQESNGKVSAYVYQLERGEEGTLHVQFYVRWENAKSFEQAKDAMGSRCHIEVCHKSKAAQDYCSKMDTRVGPCYTNLDRIEKKLMPNPLSGKEMYRWENDLVAELGGDADERKVIWYVDPIGGAGKTTFLKYLYFRYGQELLIAGGKRSDICYMALQAVKSCTPRICVANLTRAEKEYVSYSGLESLKDGVIVSTKYESKTIVLTRCVHVVVFANYEPDVSKLSADRWSIRRLGRHADAGWIVQRTATVVYIGGENRIVWLSHEVPAAE